jgi:hypothetical protein
MDIFQAKALLKSNAPNYQIKDDEVEAVYKINLYHSRARGHIHLDEAEAQNFDPDAKVYRSLPLAHSSRVCPNRVLRRNCEKEGVEVRYSQND